MLIQEDNDLVLQGREADVIVMTTVRCNKEGRLGFVSDPRRLNVAISRPRRLVLLCFHWFHVPAEFITQTCTSALTPAYVSSHVLDYEHWDCVLGPAT